jgi:hypothetical protein
MEGSHDVKDSSGLSVREKRRKAASRRMLFIKLQRETVKHTFDVKEIGKAQRMKVSAG